MIGRRGTELLQFASAVDGLALAVFREVCIFLLVFCVASRSPLVASISVTGGVLDTLTLGNYCPGCWRSFALLFGAIERWGMELLPFALAIISTIISIELA